MATHTTNHENENMMHGVANRGKSIINPTKPKERNAFSELESNVPQVTQHQCKKQLKNKDTFRIFDENMNDATKGSERSMEHQSVINKESSPVQKEDHIEIEESSDEDENMNVEVAETKEIFDDGLEDYEVDIHANLRHQELDVNYSRRANYMDRQKDLTPSMRSILADWLTEVTDEYKMKTQTLHLAMNYVDRFLSRMMVTRSRLQLVGTAAMYIASKFEEIYPPEVVEFVYVTDDTYTKKQVLRMEHLLLKVLHFNLSTPTPLVFLNFYLKKIVADKNEDHLAHYLCDLTLMDLAFLHFTASQIAVSAILLARHMLRPANEAPGDIEDMVMQISGYEPSQICACVKRLWEFHASVENLPQQAVREKYSDARYNQVSNLASPRDYPFQAVVDDEPMDA